jgi:death on curing protein
MLIDEIGGSHGIRDHHGLLVLEELPRQSAFGQELYPSIFEKAAVYVRGIIHGHPFIDGNKRTAMTAAMIFLENNGYESTAKTGEIETAALDIISQKHDIPKIAQWLKQHTKKENKKRQ